MIKQSYKKLLSITQENKIEVISTGDVGINNIYEEYAYATLKCGKYTLSMYQDLNVEILNMLRAVESKHVFLDRYSDFMRYSLDSGEVDKIFTIKEIHDAGTLIMNGPTGLSYYSNNLDEIIEIVAKTVLYENFEDIILKDFSHILSVNKINGAYKVRGVKHEDYNKSIKNHEDLKNSNSNS